MEGFDTQTVIVVIALLTGMGFIFRLLLAPVYARLARLEEDVAGLKAGQARLEEMLKELLANPS